jgi:hypothetical protein
MKFGKNGLLRIGTIKKIWLITKYIKDWAIYLNGVISLVILHKRKLWKKEKTNLTISMD